MSHCIVSAVPRITWFGCSSFLRRTFRFWKMDVLKDLNFNSASFVCLWKMPLQQLQLKYNTSISTCLYSVSILPWVFGNFWISRRIIGGTWNCIHVNLQNECTKRMRTFMTYMDSKDDIRGIITQKGLFTWIIIFLVRGIAPLLVLRSITVSGWFNSFGAQFIATRTSTRRIINVTRWAVSTHKSPMSSVSLAGRSIIKFFWSLIVTRRSMIVSKPWNDSF